jgi:hypothetical protein
MEQSLSWKVNSHKVLNKFPAFFHGTRRIITVFTRVHHWLLFWARLIHSTPSYPIFLRSILMLSSNLHLVVPSDLIPCFPTKILYAFLISHACYMPHPSHPPWFHHPDFIRWSLQVMKSRNVQSSPATRHFLPLRSKYSPQHPVPKYCHSCKCTQTVKNGLGQQIVSHSTWSQRHTKIATQMD